MDKSQAAKIKKQVQPAVKKYLETNKRAIAKDIVQNSKSNDAKGLVRVKNNCLQWVAKTVYRLENGFDFNNPVDRTRAAIVLVIFDMFGNDILIPIVRNVAASTKIGELVADLNVKLIDQYILRKKFPDAPIRETKFIAQNMLLTAAELLDSDQFEYDQTAKYLKLKSLVGAKFFAMGVVAAFNEESSKATANQFGFLKEYQIFFNVVEFTQYVVKGAQMHPENIANIVSGRILAVFAHIVFGLCHKIGIGWLGYILHAVWNTFNVAIIAKIRL